MAVAFLGLVSQEVVKAKWDDYLRLKQVAKDLVKQKMEERADILREMKTSGGYNSRFFWSRAQWKKGKGCPRFEMIVDQL